MYRGAETPDLLRIDLERNRLDMNWTIGNSVQVLATVTCILLLIAAAIGDVRRYRIPNNLVIGVVVCFVIFAAAKASWVFVGWSLAAAACTFAVAVALFAFGLFGGGDTKLTAAMALWTQFHDLPRFLVVMTLFGGILGVVWMIRRRRRRPAAPDAAAVAAPNMTSPQHIPAMPNKLPYGVAIAIAGIDFFLFSANSPLAGVLSGQ
jgi:prepilin peptidase CpaA